MADEKAYDANKREMMALAAMCEALADRMEPSAARRAVLQAATDLHDAARCRDTCREAVRARVGADASRELQ